MLLPELTQSNSAFMLLCEDYHEINTVNWNKDLEVEYIHALLELILILNHAKHVYNSHKSNQWFVLFSNTRVNGRVEDTQHTSFSNNYIWSK